MEISLVHPIQSERCVSCVKKTKKLTEDKAIIIKTMEATTPELVLLASGVQNPVPSAVATPLRSCKKLSKSTAEYKTVGRSKFLCSA